jgi:hypothetical protein
MGGQRVNEGDQSEGIWLMDFIYVYELEQETSCNCFKWGGRRLRGRDDGGDVQYKSNRNCHYESSLYNEYILIKI